MSYQMSNIRSLSVSGIKSLITQPSGYSIHPITYKNNKYVVDFEIETLDNQLDDKASFSDFIDASKIIARVYSYREKRSIFFGRKGKKICETDITIIPIGDNQEFDLRRTNEDDIKIHLPEIMQIIFDRWERHERADSERQAAIKVAEAWDGVVQ